MSKRLAALVVLALTLAMLGFAAVAPEARAAATFVVNKTGDASDLNLANSICDTSTNTGKQCTLRAAIQEANDTPGTDTINFNITSSSKVIAPATPLPPITGTVLINGYSQAGASANTQQTGNNAVLKIVLDGVNLPADSVGLDVRATKSTIKGLDIQRFGGAGVVLANTKIALLGNYIGTNVAGTVARANGVGVRVVDTANTIGGSTPADRNVISGNTSDGVFLDVPSTDVGNSIRGNYIGTNKTGAAGLGNGDSGVHINNGAKTTIGGLSSGERNVISANGFVGVNIFGTGVATGTIISGNYLGTNAAGTAALPNDQGGIRDQLGGVTIGGDTAGERNVISGNGISGVFIGADNSFVQGNYIGVDESGTLALGNAGNGVSIVGNGNTVGGATAALRNVISANGGHGVHISDDSNVVQGNRIGTKANGTGDLGNHFAGVEIFSGDNNTIGGSGSAGNVIANSGQAGVELFSFNSGTLIKGNTITGNDGDGVVAHRGTLTVGGNAIVANGGIGVLVRSDAPAVRISGNQIFANTGLGIDVSAAFAPDGVTPNDTDDPDSGGNGLQNFPILSGAVFNNQTHLTTISGSLNSNASTQFTIELFFAAPDSTGHGQAQALLASQNITTNSGGNKAFAFQLAGLAPGMQLTATATSTSAGRTSEFSANLPVT